MANLIVWTNNASSLLASGIASSDTTVTMTAGQGALFPAISAGQYSVGTLEDTNGNIEIVYITGRTTDTMTITRAEEDTTALSFASGSRFELRVTAGVLATLLQKTGGDVMTGTTTVSGVLALGSGGSIQGGEYAGGYVRGSPGETDNQFHVPTAGGAPTIGGSVALTASNVATNLPSGTSLCLTNMIVFWAGASNAIPSGWVLCNGQNGTPDLRDQFIVGGGGSDATSGGSSNTTTGATALGSLSIAGASLTTDQLPAHNHTIWIGGYANPGGSGSPVWLLGGGSQQNVFPAGESFAGQQIIGNTGSGNPHTHALGGSSSHAHTYNYPPYTAVFAIMKT